MWAGVKFWVLVLLVSSAILPSMAKSIWSWDSDEETTSSLSTTTETPTKNSTTSTNSSLLFDFGNTTNSTSSTPSPSTSSSTRITPDFYEGWRKNNKKTSTKSRYYDYADYENQNEDIDSPTSANTSRKTTTKSSRRSRNKITETTTEKPTTAPESLETTTTSKPYKDSTTTTTTTKPSLTITPTKRTLSPIAPSIRNSSAVNTTVTSKLTPALRPAFFATTPKPLSQSYADKSQNHMNEFIEKQKSLKDDLDYNKYIAAAGVYSKAKVMVDYIDGNISLLLRGECRPSEFPQYIIKMEKDQVEPCQTTRAKIDKMIEDFEKDIMVYKEYREGVRVAENHLDKELKNLQKLYELLLNSTLMKFRRGDPNSSLKGMIDKDIEQSLQKDDPSFLPLDANVEVFDVRRSPAAADNFGIPEPKFSKTRKYGDDGNTLMNDLDDDFATSEEFGFIPEDVEQMEVARVEPTTMTSPQRQTTAGNEESSIVRKFDAIDSDDNIPLRKKMDAYTSLLNEIENYGIEDNPDIFTLAALIKNCKGSAWIASDLKLRFPEPVVRIVWDQQVKLQLTANGTKFKIFADGDYNVQQEEILEGNSNLQITGEMWKFVPIADGRSFLIYNIQRQSVMKAIKSESTTVNSQQSIAVTMEDVKDRDITLLPRKPEYMWTLELGCVLVGDEPSSGEKITHWDQTKRCFVIIQNNFYPYLALNFNKFGYVNLEMRDNPGYFAVKAAK